MNPSILIYGRTKTGKTTDAFYAFRRSVFGIVTEHGALDSVEANFGFVPPNVVVTSPESPFRSIMEAIKGPAAKAVASGARCVIWDGLSAWGDRLQDRILDTMKHDGRKAYPQIALKTKAAIDEFLALPAWHIVLAHEGEPRAEESRFVRGGPMLPTAGMTESVSGRFRLVMRAVVKSGSRVYECDSMSAQWIQGDAYGCAAKEQIMDLRPLVWRIMKPGEPAPEELMAPKPYRCV